MDNGDSKPEASLAVKYCGLTRHDKQECSNEWLHPWSIMTVEKAELEAEMALLYWQDRDREMD